jgi:predicted metalloprotease with PDZ domain
VRVFRQKFTLEDAIGFHAFAPLEASRLATNSIPLGCPLFLPVHTVNSVQTLKVRADLNEQLGILLATYDNTTAEVLKVKEESAAAMAGILVGHQIVHVNGEGVDGLSRDDLHHALHAEATTSVITLSPVVAANVSVMYGSRFSTVTLEDAIEFHDFAPLEALPCV